MLESRSLQVRGRSVHYLSAGQGATHLLLLHGGGADSARLSYGDLVPGLSSDFTVLAPDFPGYGGSAAAENGSTTAGMAEFVISFLDALGLDQVDVGGLSMGGGVTLTLLARHGDRFRRAVLIGSHGLTARARGGVASGWGVRLPLVYRAAWRYAASDEKRTRHGLRRVFADPSVAGDELVAQMREAYARPGSWRMFQDWTRDEVAWNGRVRTCLVDQLPSISHPVLLVHGTADKLVSYADAKAAAGKLPHGSFLSLDGCGHWVPRERPDELSAAMKRFLLRRSVHEHVT